MELLEVGTKAPEFNLLDKDGNSHSLKEIKAKYRIVYFYPKDNTPGCIIEAREFSSHVKKFEEVGAAIIGISGGDEKSKTKFCKNHKLKILLLSDPDFTVSKAYGVYGPKKFMGRSFNGISRVTFVIDDKGKIIHVFPKVSALGHAEEVFELVRKV